MSKMSHHRVVLRPSCVARVEPTKLDESIHSVVSVTTEYVFGHDALSNDAKKIGDKDGPSIQCVLLHFCPPFPPYEITGQNEEQHGNCHHD
jgi:hypothetical protein